MTEGMVAMADEAMETAIPHFDFVLGMPEELDNRFLLAIAYYWKGRCLRRRGDYDEALVFTGKGRDLALELESPRMAAVMQVLEGWILFQQGKWKEAVRVSEIAENELRSTDDYVTLGNIQSFYGRMARREGRFDKAIELFENAIEHYRKRDPQHPNLARSLANMALAKRGIALQIQRRIDADAQRRRKTSSSAAGKRVAPPMEPQKRRCPRGRPVQAIGGGCPSCAAKRSIIWPRRRRFIGNVPIIMGAARCI